MEQTTLHWQATEGWNLTANMWTTRMPGLLHSRFPGANDVTLEIEVDLLPESELCVLLGYSRDLGHGLGQGMDGCYLFRLGQGRGDRFAIERPGYGGDRLFAEAWEPAVTIPGLHLLRVELRDGRLSLSADSVEILVGCDEYPLRFLDTVCIQAGGAVTVRSALLRTASASVAAGKRLPQTKLAFHATVDVPDDLMGDADWDDETVRKLIRTLADRGVRRVYWIDYLGRDGGLWASGSWWLFNSERPRRFYERVPEPMAVVSDECHRLGLEAYGQVKPFDLAFGAPWAVSPDDEPSTTGLQIVGGWMGGAPYFLRQHPDRRLRLHPALVRDCPVGPSSTVARPEGVAIGEICLHHWGSDPLELRSEDLTIWVSRENRTYTRYEGQFAFEEHTVNYAPPRFVPAPAVRLGGERPCRRVRLSGLEIDTPYIAVEMGRTAAAKGITNFISALVSVTDTKGRPVPLTYGLVGSFLPGQDSRIGDFREVGIAFDAAHQTPYAQWGRGAGLRQSIGRHPFTLRPGGWVGMAIGRNLYPNGYMDLSYPEVREWLLARFAQLFELGADGVDLRFTSHTETLDWENYGFSEPVRRAYRERYGVDIAEEVFDRSLWRRLKGEYVDTFIRDTKAVADRNSGSVQVHLEPHMAWGPEGNCFLETAWNWRRWIDEGWIDSINLAEGPESIEAYDGNPFWEVVRDTAASRGVPVYSQCRAALVHPKRWFEAAAAFGVNGFILYETAGMMQLSPDGEFVLTRPEVFEAMKGFSG